MKTLKQYISEAKKESPTTLMVNAVSANGLSLDFKSEVETQYGIAVGAHAEGRTLYVDMKEHTAYEMMIPFSKFNKADKTKMVAEV